MIAQEKSEDEWNKKGHRRFYNSGNDGRTGECSPADDTEQRDRDTFIKDIFAAVAADIDFLSSFFSLGLDQGWRKKLVSLLELKGGEKVLDVCTGTGKLAFLLSKKVGKSGAVLGVDFSREMLEEARKKQDSRLPDINFSLSDAKHLEFSENSFDAVTVSFGMRNIPDTSAALCEAYRVLKPGGKFCCLELTPPDAGWVKPLYTEYCFRVMPFIARKVLKTDVPYNYLPRSIKAFPSSEEFKGIMEACGFIDVNVYPMTFGIATIFESRKN